MNGFRISIGLCEHKITYPPSLPNAVSVRQVSDLLVASFRHYLTIMPLPFANASPYRAHSGLSPYSHGACHAHLFKYYPFGANKQDDTQAQIWVLLNRDLLRELPLVGYRFASHYP